MFLHTYVRIFIIFFFFLGVKHSRFSIRYMTLEYRLKKINSGLFKSSLYALKFDQLNCYMIFCYEVYNHLSAIFHRYWFNYAFHRTRLLEHLNILNIENVIILLKKKKKKIV